MAGGKKGRILLLSSYLGFFRATRAFPALVACPYEMVLRVAQDATQPDQKVAVAVEGQAAVECGCVRFRPTLWSEYTSALEVDLWLR